MSSPIQSMPRWPAKFATRRQFNFWSENEPFINFLCGNNVENEDGENELILESEDQGEKDKDREKDDKLDPNGFSVRKFMEGMTGDEDLLLYYDHVDEVAGFCEQAEHETNGSQIGKQVALLDDRNRKGMAIDSSGGQDPRGQCRPYLGPLTSNQLARELIKKRLQTGVDQDTGSKRSENEDVDAEKRLIFIVDLHAATLQSLAVTASITQAPALKDLFYKYLTGKSSIGVTVPSRGVTVFTLDFHIPYFALRVSDELHKDTRKRHNGEPLRQSWSLPFLPVKDVHRPKGEGAFCLYEAQMSVAITGIDHWVWTAYGLVDTYFEKKETVDGYDKLRDRHDGTRPDPLAAGRLSADNPIWTPREYFLALLEVRIQQVVREWNHIVYNMEEEVKGSKATCSLSASSNDTKARRKKLRDFSTRMREMVKILSRLISGLSGTLRTWEEFRSTDIGYFEPEGSPSSPQSFGPSIVCVAKSFSKLHGSLAKLKELKIELCEDSPQGIHAHLSLENNEAAIFQQKAARNIEVLTVITIIFFPLSLAANLFSTTGVLPFEPNVVRFTFVLLTLTSLVVATLIALRYWRSWYQRILEVAMFIKVVYFKDTFDGSQGQVDGGCDEKQTSYSEPMQKNGVAITLSMATHVLDLKKRLFPHRYRTSCKDLEGGSSEPLMGGLGRHDIFERPPIFSPSLKSDKSRSKPETLKGGGGKSSPTLVPLTCTSTEPFNPSGRHFRLLERDEDLLDPTAYNGKLSGLRASIGQNSSLAQTGFTTPSGLKSIQTAITLLQECRKVLTCIVRNIIVLQDAGFCSSTATFLQIDPNRSYVAFLNSIDIDGVAKLEHELLDTKTASENLMQLDIACQALLGPGLLPCTKDSDLDPRHHHD